MGTESAPPESEDPIDGRLAALAERQHGVVSREQLRRLGLGEHGIARRVRSGRLHRLYRGVYSVGHPVLGREGRWMAAVLAGGPGAVLSHASAGSLWDIRASGATRIDVTIPQRGGRRERPGLRVHRSRRLGRHEVTLRRRIPVTTLARTLLDLADVLDAQALKRVVDEAEYLRLLDMAAVHSAIARNPGRAGAKLTRAARGPLELTRSAAESLFLAVVERHGLPRPRVGVEVGGYEVDFYWPDANLIVELDGFAAHGTRKRFENDRRRDRRLARAGLQTIRLTPTALSYEEDAIAEELGALTSRSRASS
jgi:very-short-patch-repair endonuclease